MAREGIPSAVLLDALGTLIELETPWPHLVEELGARGVVVSEDAARAAMLAEMAYYRAHHDEAGSWAGLEDLRRRCAAVVQERARRPRCRSADVQDALLAAHPLPRLPRGARRARAPARRRRAPGRRLQLGRLAARRPRAHRAARARRHRRDLGRARRGQARPGDLPRRARPAGRDGGRRDARRRQRRARRRGRARGGPAGGPRRPRRRRGAARACASSPRSTAS